MTERRIRKMRPKPTRYRAFEGPVLVTLDEKHGNFTYLCANEAELHSLALFILGERHSSGWYYDPSEESEPEAPEEVDPEVIESLPTHMQEVHSKKLKEYQSKLARYEAEQEEWNEILAAIEHEDGRAALQVLLRRTDHEYEHINIEKAPEFPRPSGDPPDNPRHGQMWVHPVDGYRMVWDDGRKGWIQCKYVRMEHNIALANGTLDIAEANFERSPLMA